MSEDADFVILSHSELESVLSIFQKFSLHEFYRDETGKLRKRLMQQKHIWISDKNFLKKNQNNRTIKGLLSKNVIKPHLVGHKISIKAQYLNQIYTLADSNEWELLKQLAGVWLDVSIETENLKIKN